MTSGLSQIVEWINIYKLGLNRKDRLIIFIFMTNFIIMIITLMGIFGKEKGFGIYLKNTWLSDWIPGKNLMINSDGIILSIPTSIENLTVIKPDYENIEKTFVTSLGINTESVVIDVGAHMGLYSIFIAKKSPSSKIIAIEASPSTFKNLKLNCKLNDVHNIILYHNAVFDQNEKEIEFFEGIFSTVIEEFLPDLGYPEDKVHKISVKSITIDSLVDIEKIDQIDLLKIDIEGGEILALKGAMTTLEKKKIKNIIVEYHFKDAKKYTIDLLEKLGYQLKSHDRVDYVSNENIVNGHVIASIKHTNFLDDPQIFSKPST